MCTAIGFKSGDFYFGRTLDNEFSFGEQITIVPRNFRFDFRFLNSVTSHYAIIGMGIVKGDYPLLFDAMNEKGLCMAGLNFVGNAFFNEVQNNKENVAVFEFIPWILSQCANVTEVRERLGKINLVNEPFSKELPVAQLHWMITDKDECITVEAVKDGLKIYDNPVGVMTNNPTFPEHIFNLNNYMHLSPKAPENNFSKDVDLKHYSKGMGAIGLPGDLSSMSRFVRVAFVKSNSASGNGEGKSISQFFHILNSVDQQRGCNLADRDMYEITVYTSCCNASKGIYYYTTYDNHQISCVNMFHENLDSCKLKCYPLIMGEQINCQN